MIKAFLEGDRAVFESVCDEQPQTVLSASLKERKFKGVTWDTQILDVRNVGFNKVCLFIFALSCTFMSA